jgi:tripartite-type tricarboxylate transporter receptor subunit TctC
MVKIKHLVFKTILTFFTLIFFNFNANADISVIVPFNKGGDSTVAAETQSEFFSKYFNEAINVIHQPSTTRPGVDAWENINKEKPDGKTLVVVNIPTIILQPLLYSDVKYKTDDLSVFAVFQSIPNGIIVKDSSRFKTLAELIDFAKKNPEQLTAGGVGFGGIDQLIIEQLNKEAGIKINYKAYSGQAPAENGLIAKEVDFLSGATSSAIRLADQARVLAFTSEDNKRLPLFPNIPTFKELNLNISTVAYRGYALPKATPAEIKKKFSDNVLKVNRDPEFIKKIESKGFIVKNIGMDAVPGFMKEQIKFYQPLVGLINKK